MSSSGWSWSNVLQITAGIVLAGVIMGVIAAMVRR